MPMILNGNGSISGLSVGGLPDGVVKQEDLAPNVAGNGPAFSVTMSAAQNIAHATSTIVAFNQKEFDTHSSFNIGTYSFQPAVAGFYWVVSHVIIPANAGEHSIELIKNGTSYKVLSDKFGSDYGSGGSALVYLNGVSDYIQIRFYQSSGSTSAINNLPNYSYFQGFLARAA